MNQIMLTILGNFHWICLAVYIGIELAYNKSRKDDYWLD